MWWYIAIYLLGAIITGIWWSALQYKNYFKYDDPPLLMAFTWPLLAIMLLGERLFSWPNTFFKWAGKKVYVYLRDWK
jgi:hypothetical protein